MPNPVAGLIAGGASVGGSILSSNAQKKAANAAASAETYAAELQIDEARRQFDQIRQLMSPYVNAGNMSLVEQQSLAGLLGSEAQRASINDIQNSSQFSALQQQGENAILQNASATGGLRGGNTQGALAQFRPALLNQLIESQYSKLGGLTSIGQNAAAGVGNAGMTTTGQINQALGNMGSAQAGAALARGQANANMIGGITNAFGTLAGSGAFGSSITPSASSVANYNALGNVQFGGF
jgi:hypothetical protein